jgi:hypothetical protein
MSFIVILLAMGTGLLIGSRVMAAHDAHVRFSKHRTATNSDFGAWFKSAVGATVSIAAVVLLIYAIYKNG